MGIWFYVIVCMSGPWSCLTDSGDHWNFGKTREECERFAAAQAVSRHERTGREYAFHCYQSDYEPKRLELKP